VPIDHIYFFGFETANSREKKASWLKALLHTDDRGIQGGVTSVSLLRSNANDVEALMSALPFARSTHSVDYSTMCIGQDDTFEQIDLPWLAYAIFHPNTTASSWCHLKLTDLTLTEHSTHALTAMARGNNLLAVLTGTLPMSDAYYCAQLAPGTVVEREPCWTTDGLLSHGMQDTVFAAPLDESTPTTVDVCGIASPDSATWNEWVQVIIPAYGLGWVRASELHNVRAHSPSKSGLSALRLCRKHNFGGVPNDPPEVLLHVLRPLGAMLAFLDVSEYNDVAASTMGDILRACPRLKTLIASHNGDLWSDAAPRIAPFETALEALELRVPSGHTSFSAPGNPNLQSRINLAWHQRENLKLN
jgi:hypothetical protein